MLNLQSPNALGQSRNIVFFSVLDAAPNDFDDIRGNCGRAGPEAGKPVAVFIRPIEVRSQHPGAFLRIFADVHQRARKHGPGRQPPSSTFKGMSGADLTLLPNPNQKHCDNAYCGDYRR
jgi:hypothetical protein